jgi:hypothetical protein
VLSAIIGNRKIEFLARISETQENLKKGMNYFGLWVKSKIRGSHEENQEIDDISISSHVLALVFLKNPNKTAVKKRRTNFHENSLKIKEKEKWEGDQFLK